MRAPAMISLWLVMDFSLWGAAERDNSCQDEMSSCRKIGTRFPLTRCYTREDRCCATCNRLRLPNPECPFGDKANSCGSIGGDRPISDCYTDNSTCCETCASYSRGTPGCEYGDKLNWCSDIGTRFFVSSCYKDENKCCDTCARFRKSMPGCEYGDHANWCSLIDREFCMTDPITCCETCSMLMTSATAAPPAPNRTPTTVTVANGILKVTESTQKETNLQSNISVQNTYTGSPGRPSPHNRTAPSGSRGTHVIHSLFTVLHSTVSPPKHKDLNWTRTTTPRSWHRSNSTNITRDLDIICSQISNSTGHRIRHSKHGGRHRSRGPHLNPICRDIMVSDGAVTPGVPPTTTSEPLWLLISKGMAPQTSSVTHTPKTFNDDLGISKADQVTWSDRFPATEVSMTTKRDTGWLGEMDYQEDYLSVYSSANLRHSMTTVGALWYLVLWACIYYGHVAEV